MLTAAAAAGSLDATEAAPPPLATATSSSARRAASGRCAAVAPRAGPTNPSPRLANPAMEKSAHLVWQASSSWRYSFCWR